MPRDERVESEEALIQGFLAPLAAGFPGAFGLSDDCASLRATPGEELVLTTDAVAEGVHFLTDDAAEDIAWKALAVNVSDLAAKGARPILYLMSLAFPQAPELRWLEKFAAGLAAAQARFGLVLAGGDTDRRPGPLAITITAIGGVAEGRMVRRATANAGDRIFVSGTLGDGAVGLRLRQSPALAETWHLDAGEARSLVGRYLRPEPRLELRHALVELASAAMDISDGLAKDLGRMCKASGVRGVVRGIDVPLSAPLRKVVAGQPQRFTDVVAGGDDYEVLAAVSRANCDSYRAAAAAGGVTVTEIGALESGSGVVILDRDGRELRLDKSGWEHF